jgi:hypothetical protein
MERENKLKEGSTTVLFCKFCTNFIDINYNSLFLDHNGDDKPKDSLFLHFRPAKIVKIYSLFRVTEFFFFIAQICLKSVDGIEVGFDQKRNLRNEKVVNKG